jgi:type IV secretory pathway VirJ component
MPQAIAHRRRPQLFAADAAYIEWFNHSAHRRGATSVALVGLSCGADN